MEEIENGSENAANNRFGRNSLIVTGLAVVAMAAAWGLAGATAHWGWKLVFLACQVVVISIVIWQACDPFADAAQWIGKTFRLPGSVRGATLDAIASSMPELFSGIFFVVVAMTAKAGGADVPAGEGYGSTVATCAGSAVYNMILIPAFCALFISFYRKRRPTIDVEPEVLSRDGLWFLGCSMVLIVFLFMDTMNWWMAVVLLVLYAIYVAQLYFDAAAYRRAQDAIHKHFGEVGPDSPTEDIVATLRAERVRATPRLVDELRRNAFGSGDDEDDDEEGDDSAGALFGYVDIPLNMATAWIVIGFSTIVAAAACYWLVEATNATAEVLEVPTFFVAVILAAAASSVPDTFLSIMAAKRGDDSGAVSNAFGSNIFDICICLSIPLPINCGLNDWRPIELIDENDERLAGLVDLRMLLCVLTVVTLLIMWHNRQLTRNKAYVLCALYGVFIIFAILGANDLSISEMLGIGS